MTDDWRKEARVRWKLVKGMRLGPHDIRQQSLDDLPRALDMLDEMEAWLRGIPCQEHDGRGEIIMGTEPYTDRFRNTCPACGGEGTEWARFQRRGISKTDVK